MKNHACLFVFAFLFPVIAWCQAFDQEIFFQKEKSLVRQNHIRFIMGWTYEFRDEKQVPLGKKSSFEKFDKEGNLIEEVYYNQSGGTNFECTYDYDAKGWEISRISNSIREYISRRWVYRINDKTGETEQWPSKSFNSKEHKSFKLDPSGRKIQETLYDAEGSQVSTLFFNYDESGNVKEKLELDGSNNLFEKWNYEYDENDNCTSAIQYDSDNKIFLKYFYLYDEKGNKIEELITDAKDSKKQKTKFIYQPYNW